MRVTLYALTAWSLVLAIPAETSAYGLGQTRDQELAQTSRRAAAYLLALQLRSGGWAWEEGSGKQGENFGGIVGESLLAAYEQTWDGRYLEAAGLYADELVQRFRRNPRVLPYKPDIEFLVRATEVSGDPVYAEAAVAWFKVVMRTSPRGADEVERIRLGRGSIPNITGYDVALGVRAALAVEEYTYARELADAVLASRGRWLSDPASNYGTVSRAALLDALLMLDPVHYRGAVASLAGELVAEQGKNGSWCFNETQSTAYAVRALARLPGTTTQSAALRGARWLDATLLRRGAWADYNDGMPEPFVGTVITEVQAEALTALIIAGQL